MATPLTRTFSAAAVQYCYADANTGVGSVNTKVNLALGEGNGQKTGIYLVSQTAASIASALGLTALTIYSFVNGDLNPPAGGSLAAYFNNSAIQAFYADANTGVSGVNSQVDLRIKLGNGALTGNALVSQTVATIAASVGNGGTQGTATLVAGTVTVANTNITATSIITLSYKTIGGTAGILSYTLNAGVGFTINSSSNTDTSVVVYSITY